jgi:hypothetical protein
MALMRRLLSTPAETDHLIQSEGFVPSASDWNWDLSPLHSCFARSANPIATILFASSRNSPIHWVSMSLIEMSLKRKAIHSHAFDAIYRHRIPIFVICFGEVVFLVAGDLGQRSDWYRVEHNSVAVWLQCEKHFAVVSGLASLVSAVPLTFKALMLGAS